MNELMKKKPDIYSFFNDETFPFLQEKLKQIIEDLENEN